MWEKSPLRTGHVIRRMRSGCKRIVNGIMWEISELITHERIGIRSSNLGTDRVTAMYDQLTTGQYQKVKDQGHNVT